MKGEPPSPAPQGAKTRREVPITERLTLTVAEAALLTGIQREYLDAEIRAERLRPMNIPGARRVARIELDRWITATMVR